MDTGEGQASPPGRETTDAQPSEAQPSKAQPSKAQPSAAADHPRPEPGPARHAASTPARSGPSRRLLLAGAAAVGIAGGVGVAVGFLEPVDRGTASDEPPAALTDALAAEQRLLAQASAALRRHPQLRPVLVQLRRDHAAHLRAVHAELSTYRRPARPTRVEGTGSAGPVLDRVGLHRVEKRAATDAAARAARLSGRSAVLLASIAACEASHAELLMP